MKKQLSCLLLGIFIGTLIFGSAIAFAYNSQIDVEFIPLNYYFNGEQKYPPADQAGFIYNGRTYVPLRFMAESLGQSVDWDESTYSIYIGSKPEQNLSVYYLTEIIRPYTQDGIDINKPFTVGNNEYTKSIKTWTCIAYGYAGFDLEQKYKKITLKVGTDSDDYYSRLYQPRIKITADDRTLIDNKLSYRDLPQTFEFDLTGVQKLYFEGTGFYILDPQVYE